MKYDKVTIHEKIYFRYRHWDPVLKKHTKTLYGSTLKELKKKYEGFQELKNAGVTETTVPFVTFCENWLYSVHMVDKKPSTKSRYESLFNTHILESYFGKIPLQKITVDDLQDFYNKKFEEKSESIVKNIHKLIKPCVRYAFNNGMILRNFADFVKIPRDLSQVEEKNKKVKPLTMEEHKVFVKGIAAHKYTALFNTALDTGMRQGELFALTWDDLDFYDMTIRINKNHSRVKDIETQKHKNYTTNTKTAKSNRIIPMAQRTKNILMIHQRSQKEQLLRIGIIQTGETLVFGNLVNKPLDSHNILKELKRVYKKLGIEGKTFHDLRHTYATRLFELGEPAKTVQELLGHSNINVTLGTYTHVLEKQKIKTASKIDAIYDFDIRDDVPDDSLPVGYELVKTNSDTKLKVL